MIKIFGGIGIAFNFCLYIIFTSKLPIHFIIYYIMKLTEQQSIVLLDIAKSAMNHSSKGFAGYSKEQLMSLVNDIISQQDNTQLISPTHQDNTHIDHDLLKVGMVEDPETVKLEPNQGLQDVTHEVLQKISGDDFWDDK